MFNAKQFCEDYNIQHSTEGPNCSPGYVNIQCPMCSDNSNHGGFNIEKEFYNCWLCNGESIINVIKELLNINYWEAKKVYEHYCDKQHIEPDAAERKAPSKLDLPKEAKSLSDRHRNYLIKRNFDPDKLEREFNLHGTGIIGNYKQRIIAPIYLDGKLISYQGRDITDKHTLRYKACKKEDEVVHHKHSLYNIDKADGYQAVIVEGITDAWRLGAGAIATFGTGFTVEQLKLLVEKYMTLFLFYDEAAREKAEELATMFTSFYNKEAILLTDSGYDDPALMAQSEADYMMKYLGF